MKKATELDMNRTVEELLESELGFILLEADVKTYMIYCLNNQHGRID